MGLEKPGNMETRISGYPDIEVINIQDIHGHGNCNKKSYLTKIRHTFGA